MDVNQVTGEFQFDLWVNPPNNQDKPAIKTQNRFAALAAVSEEIEGQINAANQPETVFRGRQTPCK